MSATPITFSPPSTPSDVEIRILSTVYHLHSNILRSSCSFFDKSLSDTWRKDIDPVTASDGLKYRYILVFEEGGADSFLESDNEVSRDMVAAFDKICTERLSLGETTVDDIWYGTEKTQNPNGTDDVYAKLELWKDQLQGAYENLFRIFYHRSCSQTITTIDDTRRVLELADKYCCLSTVSAVLTERVLSAPTEHSGLFSLQPVMMLNVSIKLRSKILFHDAFVHLVGRWKSLRHNSVAELPEGVRKLVEQEYMRICEDQLHTIHSVIGSYSNNATLTLIRSCINDNKPSKMYRGLSNITNCTIPVNGLTKNNLRLGGTAEFDHLTCACLRDNDYPWEGGDWW